MGDTEVSDRNPTEIEIDRPVDVEDAPFAREGERFDRIGVLGKGGMGEVRLYRDRRIARYVAYKVLRKSLDSDPQFRSRFLVEARVQGQLEHPAIVPVHDLGETEDGELFFSMKCVRGVTLRQALDMLRRGQDTAKYSRRRLLSAFASVCLAVDFAHARGVVHRDLKPQNVMLGQFGEVYVLDWGIAKVMNRGDTPGREAIDIADGADTHSGATLGTPKYMAPERQFGVANPATDVYALGVMLGEIFSGEPGLEVAPELEKILARATALTAEVRYPNARELHDDLEHYLDGDRDLEARRKLAEEHAARAEEAVQSDQRAEAGHAIGRALGLDPSNPRAMRTLMRLLTEMPPTLPPAAQSALEQHRRERRNRWLRVSNVAIALNLLLLPMFLWMGVLDWGLVAAWVVLLLMSMACQYIASFTRAKWAFVLAPILQLCTIAVGMTSMGLLGAAPAGLAVLAITWRMQVTRSVHGVLIVLAGCIAIIAPVVLAALGVTSSMYDVHDGVLVLLPKMHAFPRTPTLISIVIATCGAMGVAVLFGRLYINELRRAEERLHFQAWQLQQLLPPELPAKS